MPSVHEQLSEQFYKWESRGRGWQVFDDPVFPEPPFRPFGGHTLASAIDDGRRPSFLSSLLGKSTPSPPPPVKDDEPEAQILVRDSLVELQTSLPANLNIPKEMFEQLLSNLSLCREPIAFEVLGTPQKITLQFAVHPSDAALVRRQLQSYFPEAVFLSTENALAESWEASAGDDSLVVEFGLEREFMLLLANGKLDPFIGITGALGELQSDEVALFQVLFQPVQERWAESITRILTHADGKPFFINAPELAEAAKDKIAKPLFAAVVRLAIRSPDEGRTLQIARDVAASLRAFNNLSGNALIPLSNEDYPSFEDHVEDALRRQSRRPGMLLNSDELIGFVHLPSSAVRAPKLQREAGKTNLAPNIVRHPTGVLLGSNTHAGLSVSVRLTPEQRTRHIHIIGASGTGKSTLLFNILSQDIVNGQGVAVLDPHGDLVDRLLGSIPSERIGDVVLVDPSDEQYAIGFNVLDAHSELERQLLASDLVSVFQRLSTSWGDQMNSVLQNAILAFLESSRGGTLADLRRFLVEPAFRNEYLKSIEDSELLYYWQKGFPQLTGNKSIGPVLTRLETFLAPKPIRHMVSQPRNRLDFADIMDNGKIFLAKLSQGLLGKENSFLLGTLLVSKFQQTAMSRQAQQAAQRRDFTLVVDEFDNFISPSMAEILTGARKYRLGLVLAHHELRQLQRNPDVASAVLTHCHTRICFRIGDEDARKLSEGFAHFETRDLQNLGIGEAIARVERSDYDFNLAVPLPTDPSPNQASQRREQIITASREKYGTPRADVELALRKAFQKEPELEKSVPKDEPPIAKNEYPPIAPPQPTATLPSPLAAAAPLSIPATAIPPIPPSSLSAPTPVPEVAKPTVSEKIVEAVIKPQVPRDLGRGGEQHKAIQRRIKEAAEVLGFLSHIEMQLSDGQESADLLLERGEQRIACEISITTTIDHEVGNVIKCLKAGISNVAMICLDEERLRKLAGAVSGSLGVEAASKVGFFQPDQFIAHLKQLPRPKAPESTATRRGWKVKRSTSQISPEERKRKEEAAIRSIAEAMQQKAK